MAREIGRYKKCGMCSYVGDAKYMQHNDMACMRRAMNERQMSECRDYHLRVPEVTPKSPIPDQKF